MLTPTSTRCRSFDRRTGDRLARHVSQWSLATVVALLLFGGFLVAWGGLLTYHTCRYDLPHVVHLRIEFRGNGQHHWLWIISLYWLLIPVLIFAGNRVGSISFWELRRRLTGRPASELRGNGDFDPTWATLSFVIAPIMVLWGGICARLVFNWVVVWAGRKPAVAWINALRLESTSTLVNVCLWWTIAVSLLAGGIFIFWTGVRSISHGVHSHRVHPLPE